MPSSSDRSPENGSTGPSSANPPSRAGPKPVGSVLHHGLSVTKGCNKVVDLLWAGILLDVPRTIWKGALSFGLVNIPVGLYPATSGQEHPLQPVRGGDVRPDPLQEGQRADRRGGPQDRIVKGYDLGGGEYVILTEEELESAEPKKSRQIEISDFVGLVDIDPVFFRSSYYLAPEGAGADKAYALLRRAMAEAGRSPSPPWSCGTRSISSPSGPRTMRWPSTPCTSRTRCAIPDSDLELPETGDVTDRELSMAQLLIESMESDWDPERFHDTHREKVEALIEEKRQGHEIVLQEGPEPAAKVVDLMEALNASIAAAARPGAESKSAKRTATKRAPAKRAAPAKKAAKAAKTSRPPQGLLSTTVARERRPRPDPDPPSTCCASSRSRARNTCRHRDLIRFPAPKRWTHGEIPQIEPELVRGVQVTTAQVQVPEARIPEWMGFDGLVQLISVDGQRTVGCPYWELVADVDAAQLRDLYRDMAVVRRIDAEAMALQRQGELRAVGPAPRAGGRPGRFGLGPASGRLRLPQLPGAWRGLLPRRRPGGHAAALAGRRAVRLGPLPATASPRPPSSSGHRRSMPPATRSGSRSTAPRRPRWPTSVTAPRARGTSQRHSASPPATSCLSSSSARTTSGPFRSLSTCSRTPPSPSGARGTGSPAFRSTGTMSSPSSPPRGWPWPAPRPATDRRSSRR